MTQAQHPQAISHDRQLERKLDKAGRGVALIWIGAAILLQVGWEVGAFGLGIITLGGQVLRRAFSVPVDWFAVALGLFLCLISQKPVLGLQLGGTEIFPMATIALGAAFLISALMRQRSA